MARAVLVATLALVPSGHHRHCSNLYTVNQDVRIARTIFNSGDPVTLAKFKLLGYMERCQRNPHAQAFVRHFNRQLRKLHRARMATPPLQSAYASYYGDHGPGACGVDDVQNGYRFASLFLACGTRILMCLRTCVVAEMADHGPYIAGRTFDLNANLRAALGCDGLCWIRWRYLN